MSRKYIDISEFTRLGYLQELNRQFLHPLGMALEVVVEEDGTERLGGVWDYRDDPEGIVYGEVDSCKVAMVEAILRKKLPERRARLGFVVQSPTAD